MTITILAFVGVFFLGGIVGVFIIPNPAKNNISKELSNLAKGMHFYFEELRLMRRDIYNLRTEVNECMKELSDIINFVKERKLLEHVACRPKSH